MRTGPERSLLATTAARRRFLTGGAVVGASVLGACSGSSTRQQSILEQVLSQTPDGRLDLTDMPYRQDDPRWSETLMWDRDLVIEVATRFGGESPASAAALLREFQNGNTIGNEGCQLTCLAMGLKLLVPEEQPAWTPAALNELAHAFLYYSPSGLALATLYGDLVLDASAGVVQLVLKDEYLPGVLDWPRVTPSTSTLVRAIRRLPPQKRSRLVVMLKTGTYDDTVASHYCLLHPLDDAGPNDDNPQILDPAQPLETTSPWRLTDSAAAITGDPEIAAAWQDAQIGPTQLAGVWVFARKNPGEQQPVTPLVAAWAEELLEASLVK